MEKIEIFKAKVTKPKSRSKKMKKERFLQEIYEHRTSVQNCMSFLSIRMQEAGFKHDTTKIKFFESYFNDTLQSRTEGLDFKSLPWYQKHIKSERHHLLANIPEDVNLIDVLEMVCDSVAAGLSRDGIDGYHPINLDPELLKKALANTEKMLIKNAELRDSE